MRSLDALQKRNGGGKKLISQGILTHQKRFYYKRALKYSESACNSAVAFNTVHLSAIRKSVHKSDQQKSSSFFLLQIPTEQT